MSLMHSAGIQTSAKEIVQLTLYCIFFQHIVIDANALLLIQWEWGGGKSFFPAKLDSALFVHHYYYYFNYSLTQPHLVGVA